MDGSSEIIRIGLSCFDFEDHPLATEHCQSCINESNDGYGGLEREFEKDGFRVIYSYCCICPVPTSVELLEMAQKKWEDA